MNHRELHDLLHEHEDRDDYQIVIPLDREGDIDELDYYNVQSVTYDVAEKRAILEW